MVLERLDWELGDGKEKHIYFAKKITNTIDASPHFYSLNKGFNNQLMMIYSSRARARVQENLLLHVRKNPWA